MNSFSSILDISSFFIGVLVNLLLVAMICFYFKRKIDNLELSQSEQAKMLYNILQEQNHSIQEDRNTPSSQYNVLDGLDLNQLKTSEPEEESDSESESDSDSEDEEEETKTIQYEENNEEEINVETFTKMTVKELKQHLEKSGKNPSRNMKKQELINMIMKGQEFEKEVESVIKIEEEVIDKVQEDEITEINVNGEFELSSEKEVVDIE